MTSYFGKMIPISEAFDKYSNFKIDVKVSDSVWGKDKMEYHFDKENIPTGEFLLCSNSLCRRGGLSLTKILDRMNSESEGNLSETERCSGDHGSIQGRKIGQSCMHQFTYKVSWQA